MLDIKYYDDWFPVMSFFLAKPLSLKGCKDSSVLQFECSDDQIIHTGDKVLYNLKTRMWMRCEKYTYDLIHVIHHTNLHKVEISYFMKETNTCNFLAKEKKVLDLDMDLFPDPPIRQDYQPRKWAVETFQKYSNDKFDKSHVEKFFRACLYVCLDNIYKQKPETLEWRKPIHQGLLKRLIEWTTKMWQISPEFADVFYSDPLPIVICDQELEARNVDPEALGNIIVILTYKDPKKYGKKYEFFRW